MSAGGEGVTRYALLLRGINVGGHTRVPMAELRKVLEGLGFGGVRTHLNSGNAIFESSEGGAALTERIEGALQAAFSYRIPALILSAGEMREAVAGLPFSARQAEHARAAAGDAASLYAAFLSAEPSREAEDRMESLKRPGETFFVSGRIVYLLLEHSIRECALFSGLDKIDARATVRNWNTVTRLNEMLGG